MTAQARQSAEEYVQEAVALTLQERRPWNHTSVTLAGHLSGVVRSLVYNEAHSAHVLMRDGAELQESVDARADVSVRRPITPEEFYLSKEACERVEEDAYAAAGDDEELTAFVQAVADGAFDVSEIAKSTNMPVESIYRAKDKLKKRRKALLKEKKVK